MESETRALYLSFPFRSYWLLQYLRLSAFAAQILAEVGLLDIQDLRLHRMLCLQPLIPRFF